MMKAKLKRIGMVALIIAAVSFYGYPLFVALAGQVFPIPLHQNMEQIRSIVLLDSSGYEPKELKTIEG